jgi:hypothetical protein
MRDLIRDCHQSDAAKATMRKQAFQLFRSLADRSIIEIMPPGAMQKLRVNLDLQDDFSLNQTLALYCIDTLALLDTHGPDYALKLLSLAEAILEDPDVILRRQLEQLKGEKVAEMKAAGIEYDARMEELEKLEYPKPEREFIYTTFNQFAALHPWVGTENIRPKSIAREMFERYSRFAEYVKRYGLMRAEGVLLRHLTNVYRVLVHTIPTSFRTEAVQDVFVYLEQLLRVTDSSLIEEWETLKDPDFRPELDGASTAPASPARDLTRDRCGLERAIRDQVFHFLRLLANRDYAAIDSAYDLGALFPEARWPQVELEKIMAAYYETHRWIRLDPPARARVHTRLIESDDRKTMEIEQTLVDPDEKNDFTLTFRLSLEAVREQGELVLCPVAMQPL